MDRNTIKISIRTKSGVYSAICEAKSLQKPALQKTSESLVDQVSRCIQWFEPQEQTTLRILSVVSSKDDNPDNQKGI